MITLYSGITHSNGKKKTYCIYNNMNESHGYNVSKNSQKHTQKNHMVPFILTGDGMREPAGF